MPAVKETIEDVKKLESDKYKYGFTTEIEQEYAPKGLSEETVRFISAKKNEPEWMLDFRLKALAHWKTLQEPRWPNFTYPPIDYQDIEYYSAPGEQKHDQPKLESLDDVDPDVASELRSGTNWWDGIDYALRFEASLPAPEATAFETSPGSGALVPTAADAGRRQYHEVGVLPLEELEGSVRIAEVQFVTRAADEVGVAGIFHVRPEGVPHHTAMAGNVDFGIG